MIKLSLAAALSESGGGESVLARPNPTKSDQTQPGLSSLLQLSHEYRDIPHQHFQYFQTGFAWNNNLLVVNL